MATALEHLETFLDTLQDPESTRFSINDAGQADWALRKIGQCNRRVEDIQAVADSEIQKIQEWRKAEQEKELESVLFFTNLLDVYHWQLYQQDPKRFKSLKLPNGVIKRVKTQPTFDRDEHKLLEWLETQNLEQFIDRKAKAKWGELKKRVEVSGSVCVMPETGEVVEGVRVEPQEEKFKVEVV